MKNEHKSNIQTADINREEGSERLPCLINKNIIDYLIFVAVSYKMGLMDKSAFFTHKRMIESS